MIEQAQFAQPTMWMLTYQSTRRIRPILQIDDGELGKPFNKKNEKLTKPSGPIIVPMTGHQAQRLRCSICIKVMNLLWCVR